MTHARAHVLPADTRVPVHPVLWLMIAVMVGFEAMFALVDAGWLPDWLGRWSMYSRFAFLDLAFDVWRGQVVIHDLPPGEDTLRLHTFLTHAFLHGGWLHLVLNGPAFLGIGHMLVRSVGILRFLVVFAVCAAAGALAFGLIARTNAPMIGASGAIFGMFAMITAWQERALRRAGLSRAPIWRRIGALVVLNVVLAVGFQGMLAWEAHLGGWVAGWLLALAIRPRAGPLSRRVSPWEAAAGEMHPQDRPGSPRPAPGPQPHS